MAIKAIETQYKGYRFRSRTEARWAVFFDALDIKWEYEKEGYEFDDGTRYLPDFYLNDFRMFIEIKGEYPTDIEKSKARKLYKTTNCPIIILVGNPSVISYVRPKIHDERINSLINVFCDWLSHCHDARNAALGARFEFGEEG
jgi:hypothetical protein